MIRKTLAVVLGIVCGVITLGVVEWWSSRVYPPPANIDFGNVEAMRAFIESLPLGAFLFVLAAHAAGAFVGGFVCRTLAGKSIPVGAMIVGVFFMLAGVVNLLALPHPRWFAIADVVLYLPSVFAGAAIAAAIRRPTSPLSGETVSDSS